MLKYPNGFRFVFIGICVLFLFGCQTGAKHYEAALQLDKAGNYNNAVAYLEEAIKLEPDNQKYRDALENIKTNQINNHLSKIREQLRVFPMTATALSEAKRSLSKAEAIDSSHSDVRALSSEIDDIQTKFYSQMKSVYETVKGHMASNSWKVAYFDLQQLQSQFPAYEDSIQLMATIVDEGTAYYHQLAMDSLEQDEVSQAITHANDALSLDMVFAPARQVLDIARERDNASYFEKRGKIAVSQQQWKQAICSYGKALEYEPDNYELTNMMTKVSFLASEDYIRKAETYLEQGYLLQGFENYKKAVALIRSQKPYSLLSLQQRLVHLARNAADEFQSQGQFGSAWYWYQQVNDIDPQAPEIFYSVQEMKDKINNRIKKAIAVFDFSSPTGQQDAGVIVANHLITCLFNSASKDIKILERENLKSILEEMKLGQVGVVNQDSAHKMGKVYGIDVAIMGSVLLYDVEEQTTTGQKTIRYKVGTKIVDNIDYLNWQARNPNPTLENLKKSPQAKVMEAVYAQKDYQVSQEKKIGCVQLSFRIVDVATGENIKVDTIDVKKEVEDEGSAGLAEANIKYDPIEIMTDINLLQDLTEMAVAELGREALKPLQSMEKNYFDDAENFSKRRDIITAAEYYINAMFDEKMKMISDSPISRECQKRLHEIFIDHQMSVME